ncbi:hypothetical protein EYR40_008166 [Pleurotus pulmonarius]|nr:hypothetical protein EYR38_007521 [Pleurotus pulmonarius]KAF4597701.1 hypothetical protein EYR40_008166 [Pleurotus pulmonarius]
MHVFGRKPLKELKASKSPTHGLLFSEGGQFLITGSNDECVRVWDTFKSSAACIQTIRHPQEKWGQITSLIWARLPAPAHDVGSLALCIGSARGAISIIPFSKETGMLSTTALFTIAAFAFDHPVESMIYDRHHQRLVAASQFGVVKAYTLTSSSTAQLLWQAPSLNSMPKDLGFFGDDKVVAFLLQTGEMVCFSAPTGVVQWRKKLLGAIGHATLSRDSTKLLVNNLSTNNFDLYTFPNNTLTRTFTIPDKATRHKIKQGIFAGDNNEFVICGSLHGKIYVFDTESGACIEELQHDRNISTSIQSITYHRAAQGHFLASASTISGTPPTGKVLLWKKSMQAPQTRAGWGLSSIFAYLLDTRTMIFLLVLYVTYPSWVIRALEVYEGATAHLKDLGDRVSRWV